MIDNILSENIYPVLCFQIFTTKLILFPTKGLTYAISIVNWIFGIVLLNIIFALLFQCQHTSPQDIISLI